MDVVFNSVVIYARNMQEPQSSTGSFFGFETTGEIVDGLIDLISTNGGANIRVHQAAKSIKLGQVEIKLSFSVRDVEAFKAEAARNDLVFGSTHLANGYSFANAKDPDKNSVSTSSRAYRKGAAK